ncbi:MAG: hypothetical protein PHI98_01325 [Eubacteriales bacterium]|nr:hypothetical protein [Eubacteriales bacterium]
MIQALLTPKDVAHILRVNEDTARNEMRKMVHIELGGPNHVVLRVTEAALKAHIQPQEPLPKPERKRQRRKVKEQPERAIAYR